MNSLNSHGVFIVKFFIRVPLKVTLFGEHAVVHGKPAIASTLPIHVSIEAMDIDGDRLIITFNNVLLPIESLALDRKNTKIIEVKTNEETIKKFINYITTALDICEDEVRPGKRKGFLIDLKSPVPTGVGLGTSAAVSVGTIMLCLASYLSTTDVEKNLVAKLSWATEQRVQGAASPMDTYTITFGGIRYIDPSTPKAEFIESPIKMNFIIGYTQKRFTTGMLVRVVKERLRKLQSMTHIIDAIGGVVEEAKNYILRGDVESVGMLMNINHGLLDALGVVTQEHHVIVNMLREAGALGAKTSGAGGGGAFIALARDEKHAEILKSVVKTLGATVVATSLGFSGVEILEKQ